MTVRMQDPGRIRTDPTVAEGGTIEVFVKEGVAEVHFVIPGQGVRSVRVSDGRAEFRLPPNVRGGSTILVTDGLIPNPSQATVTVTGGDLP